jgi:hypothetical protein
MRRDVPRLVPGGVPMAAQVGGDHVEPVGEPFLGELAEAEPVPCDAVETDDERCALVAPLVGVQLHASSSGA